jgi:anti-anti-sigma regulatory factor
VLATSVGESNPSEAWSSGGGCSIELRCEASRATLVVRGTLDVWSLSALGAQLDQLTYTSNDHLIIDLRGISTIDSEVIRVLESFARSTDVSGHRLSIRCDPGPVAGWLYAAGLEPVV